MKRQKLSRKGSKKLFKATSEKTKKINVIPPLSRGGIRL